MSRIARLQCEAPARILSNALKLSPGGSGPLRQLQLRPGPSKMSHPDGKNRIGEFCGVSIEGTFRNNVGKWLGNIFSQC